MQRQMARGRMMANVPKATVVITNPTHLAVAIEYHEGMKAPKVLAKGPYHVAQRIVKIAKENRIPVIQNIPLARAIYKTIDIGQEISPDLYLAMAEVLAYVYKLRGKMPARPQPAMS
jgi:flagellar biosynthetic protein FlhB